MSRDGYHLTRYEFASRYVEGKGVLDVATGIGYGAEMLSRAGKADAVKGVDCSEEAIAYARSHYACRGLTYQVGDALGLEFQDGSFEVVVSMETMEHIADYRGFLDEISRVMKEDGTLIISTPNKKYDSRNKLHVSSLAVDEFLALLQSRFQSVEAFGQDLMSPGARFVAKANRFAGLFVPGPILMALSRAKKRLTADTWPEISLTAELPHCRNVVAICSGTRQWSDDVVR